MTSFWKCVRVNRIRNFPRLGQVRVKASYIWGVITPHIKIPQKFCSPKFPRVIPQRKTLVQHQKLHLAASHWNRILVGHKFVKG